MERKTVISSNIASIGYDSLNNILEVEFKNFSVYQYLNVPLRIFEGIMSASSHGGYLAAHVKPVYSYKRIS